MGSFLLFSVPPWPPLWLMPMPVLLATVLVWATEVPLLEVWAMEVPLLDTVSSLELVWAMLLLLPSLPLLEVPSLDMVWATEVPLLEVWDTEVPLLEVPLLVLVSAMEVQLLDMVWDTEVPLLDTVSLLELVWAMLLLLLLPMLLSLLSMLSRLLLLSPLPVSTRPSRPTWFLRPVLLATRSTLRFNMSPKSV